MLQDYSDKEILLLKQAQSSIKDLELKLRIEYDSVISNSKNTFNDERKTLVDSMAKNEIALAACKMQTVELASNLDQLKIVIANNLLIIEQYDQRIKEMELEHSKLLENEQANFQLKIQDLNRIQKQHEIDEIGKIHTSFESAKLFLKTQIKDIRKELENSELRYLNRGPREQDLKTISELNEKVHDCECNINSMNVSIILSQNELRFYRLEMNNKEANFNRIFGSQPMITQAPAISNRNLNAKRKVSTKLPPL